MCSTSGRVIREGHSIKKILKEVKRQSILIFGGQKYFRPRGQEVQNPGGGICLMSLKNSKEARRAESKEAVGIRIREVVRMPAPYRPWSGIHIWHWEL